ncbi:uncharacterized protein LY89DRAFT_689873 [Mollisia scopiformis]|uniref:Uncharacterized protein n=1 Tax=Mollisia scopiformis TaxID=149040 RepID=A0A132BDT6_MOLSC|nr:uncharacterized protein LY89DRAFT_689873 [Mollisia scopiformis]KUJ09994.1 hypothetical protein LY89DRAFT_689873 [Mollisia scopiformis]
MRQFPITFVNGYCTSCMGSDHSSHSGSINTIETVDTDVSSDVKAIGDKLDTLIESCGTIAGVVNSEARRRSSISSPVKVVQFAREVGLRPSDIKIPISKPITTSKESKDGNPLTRDITAPMAVLQEELNKYFQFWRTCLNETIERQLAGNPDMKAVKECLHASYQWLDDNTSKAFEDAERLVTSKCRERVYLVCLFVITAFFFGFLFGVWFNNAWMKV